MMTCKTVAEYLIEYLDGNLSAELLTSLEAHCSQCTCCVALIKTYQSTIQLCRTALRQPVPEEMSERIVSCLKNAIVKS